LAAIIIFVGPKEKAKAYTVKCLRGALSSGLAGREAAVVPLLLLVASVAGRFNSSKREVPHTRKISRPGGWMVGRAGQRMSSRCICRDRARAGELLHIDQWE
jgi:hypothetical protein